MATLSHSASDRTLAKSENGAGGAGGAGGCINPTWSTTICVFGLRLASCRKRGNFPEQIRFTVILAFPPAAKI